MDKDIQKLLHEIVKLSRKVGSIDFLKFVNTNGVTTILVEEVPCC